MEVIKVKYPSEEFFKFGESGDAVHIKDREVEEWVNRCLNSVREQLEDGVESPYSFTASGDTIVFCIFSQDDRDNVFGEDNYFTVIVARNYEEGTFFISDLKEKRNTKKVWCSNIKCPMAEFCGRSILCLEGEEKEVAVRRISYDDNDEYCEEYISKKKF